ncbi:MAG: type VI secretion system baseplate subunit TssE [Desulfovibrio sp.]|nr:type VI secretion system baseplate subunit TssE [Desulfovibrio sp.]
MQYLTLLERVCAMEKGDAQFGTHSTERLYRSLIRHLRALLNTRRGSVPIAPDYGIADMTDLGSKFTEESVDELKADLERLVGHYEPRLHDVRAEYTPKPDMPLAAVFSLQASVKTVNGIVPLRFQTILDAAGTVRIKGEEEPGGFAPW